jgi:hypothetical protein
VQITFVPHDIDSAEADDQRTIASNHPLTWVFFSVTIQRLPSVAINITAGLKSPRTLRGNW